VPVRVRGGSMMQVDDRYEMNLTPDKVDRILEGLR